MTTWATLADVVSVTGVSSVSAEQLAMAVGTIEIYANRTTDLPEDAISRRDLAWLKRAVCWQAAWLPGQPDYIGRQLADSISSDGQAVSRGAEYYATLAPLAARALRNLSWVGARTQRVLREGQLAGGIDFTNESSDDFGEWRPLP